MNCEESGKGEMYVPVALWQLETHNEAVTIGERIDALHCDKCRDSMDSMISGSNPVRSTRKKKVSFSESKCCADSLSVCPTYPRVYWLRTHKNVRTLQKSCSPCQSSVDYGNTNITSMHL